MNKEARIQEIEWLSKDAEEALVLITDGTYTCHAFCQPCDKGVGDLVEQSLFCFSTEGVEIISEGLPSIRRVRSTFRHEICARVVDVELGLLELGSIPLEIDVELPADSSSGDLVGFACDRLVLF